MKLRLAYCYRLLEEGDKAERLLQLAVTQFPTSPIPSRQLGSLYSSMDRKAEAEECFMLALRRDPQDHITANNLANMLLGMRGREADALVYAKQAFKRAPKNALVADTLGWAYHLNGKDAEGRPLVASAVMRLPGNPMVQYHHGVLLYREGKYAAARACLRRALAIGREFEGLEAEIQRLETEKEQLAQQLSSGDLSSEELINASNRISQVVSLIDEKTYRWLELSEFA